MTEIPSWYRGVDPMNSYLLHPQVAPKGFRPLKARIQGRLFPGKPYSEIWGYELGTRVTFEDDASCNQLERDGTLCPNVRFPGKRLDADQVRRLLSITAHPVDAIALDSSGHTAQRVRFRCGDDPVAMFVFRDEARRAVGIVSVAPGCSQWGFQPAPKDAWEGFAGVTDDEGRILRKLCAELDLVACSGTETLPAGKDESGPNANEKDVMRRALLPLLLKEWPAADESRSLGSTSKSERLWLCAWYGRAAAVAISLFTHGTTWTIAGSGFEDETTHNYINVKDFSQCVREFPLCDGTIGLARRCLTRRLETFWNQDERCPTDCVWGLDAGSRGSP